jgi:ubiquinone/menaquinone biosynthesis C-methylase UbiE
MNYVENYELIAREHLAHIAAHGMGSPWVSDALYKATQEETVAVVEMLLKPGMSVLDVGIGPGFTLEHFANTPGVRFCGVDVAAPYIERLEKLHPTWDLKRGNAEAMPFPVESMDLVLCCDVLEHVLDLHRVMRLTLDVMKPGALALFRVPYREDLRGYCMAGCRFDFVHVRAFDEYSLQLLITKCHGQECVDVRPGERAVSELFAIMRKKA